MSLSKGDFVVFKNDDKYVGKVIRVSTDWIDVDWGLWSKRMKINAIKIHVYKDDSAKYISAVNTFRLAKENGAMVLNGGKR